MPQATKRKLIISPKLEVKFSHLVKPNTKFNAAGVFSVTGLLDPEQKETQDFVALLAQKAAEAQAEFITQNKKYAKYDLHDNAKEDTDKDGNDTGKTRIDFSNKASGKNMKTNETFNVTIPIVDSKGQPMVKPKVGQGSIVRVAFDAVPFAMDSTKKIGVTLRLKAVRVIKYVPFGGNLAAVFGEAEEGFEAEADAGGFGLEEGTPTETPAGETTGDNGGDY